MKFLIPLLYAWLFIKFPTTMLIIGVIVISVLLYLAKRSPFDYELWRED